MKITRCDGCGKEDSSGKFRIFHVAVFLDKVGDRPRPDHKATLDWCLSQDCFRRLLERLAVKFEEEFKEKHQKD